MYILLNPFEVDITEVAKIECYITYHIIHFLIS